MLWYSLGCHKCPIMGGVAHLGEGVGIGCEVLGIAGLMCNVLRHITHLPGQACEGAAASTSPVATAAPC